MTACRPRTIGGLRLGLGLALVPGVIAPGPAAAQSVFRATPSFSVTQLHDDNVFSTPSRPESDLITRVSPAIDSDYRSGRLTLSGRYLLDVERFARHAELNSLDARQRAAVALGYRLSPRVTWAADAELWKTRTPGELNELTGLTFTRAAAQRMSAHVSVMRHLNPVTSGTFDYTVTDDHLAGGAGATRHDLAARVQRHRSSRETVSLDYRFREFIFALPGRASPTVAAASHALVLGWDRAITSRVGLSIDGGPRMTNASAGVDLFASVRYRRAPGDLSLTYARTQATVMGLAGVADTQSLGATVGWTVWSSTRIRVGPSAFRTVLNGARADAYMVSVDVTRPIARGLSIDLALDDSVQRGALYARRTSSTVARRAVLIRLVAGSSPLLR
jgi:hypothetical protein